MASNYFLMRESETEIFNNLNDFSLHVLKMHELVLELIKKSEEITSEEKEHISYYEEKSNNFYHEIVNDCIWVIQKDQPRASHLRFIISSINSAKELERIADYAKNIAKLLKNKNYESKIRKSFYEVHLDGIKIMKKFYNTYTEKATSKISTDDKGIILEYHKFIKRTIAEAIAISKTITQEEAYKIHIDLIIALNKLERCVEHAFNVVKAFSYINFNDKRS